ncbi:MAG: baseplate J/gp47 family protein [Flexilinea sp.]
MKTDTILLQPYDNVDSILDKVRQVANAGGVSRRILLVWPKRGRIIEESLDFGRLKIWVKHHDLQLALVVKDRLICRAASEQGIPVFSSRENAQEVNWESGKSKIVDDQKSIRQRKLAVLKSEKEMIQVKHTGGKWKYFFVLLALFSVAAVLFLLVPHAIIYLPQAETEQSLVIPLWTNDQLTTVTKNGGIPSKVEYITLNMKASVPASGMIRSSGALASGTVTLQSSCGRDQRLASGTLLMTGSDSPVTFQTLNEVIISPGDSADVSIIAVSGGKDANLPAGSIALIEEPFNSCITVVQIEPTSGGDDGIFTGPDQADYDRAAAMILEQVNVEAQTSINELYGSLRLCLSDHFTIDKITDEILTPGIGFASETLELRQTVEVPIRTVSYQDITTISKMMMDAQKVPGFIPGNESITYTLENHPQESDDGLISWSLVAKRDGFLEQDYDRIKNLIYGESIETARQELGQFDPNGKGFEIRMWPEWISRIPLVTANIWIRNSE